MPRTCEKCGASGPYIESNIPGFSGLSNVEYCELCSENLCDRCMEIEPCDEAEDLAHVPYRDEEDED